MTKSRQNGVGNVAKWQGGQSVGLLISRGLPGRTVAVFLCVFLYAGGRGGAKKTASERARGPVVYRTTNRDPMLWPLSTKNQTIHVMKHKLLTNTNLPTPHTLFTA